MNVSAPVEEFPGKEQKKRTGRDMYRDLHNIFSFLLHGTFTSYVKHVSKCVFICLPTAAVVQSLSHMQLFEASWTAGHLKYLMAQSAKNLPAKQVTQVQSLGQEDPLGKEMATHSCILVWKIPWTEEPGGLHSPWGHKRVGHNLIGHNTLN